VLQPISSDIFYGYGCRGGRRALVALFPLYRTKPHLQSSRAERGRAERGPSQTTTAQLHRLCAVPSLASLLLPCLVRTRRSEVKWHMVDGVAGLPYPALIHAPSGDAAESARQGCPGSLTSLFPSPPPVRSSRRASGDGGEVYQRNQHTSGFNWNKFS
jgi:hypothetical protein